MHSDYIPAPAVGLVADTAYSKEKALPLHSSTFEPAIDTWGAYKMQIPILSQ